MPSYPPIPQVAAYLSWELPMFPQLNSRGSLEKWQQYRCAICEIHLPPAPQRFSLLQEDHDHLTMRTRGYLCPRCNTTEGRSTGAAFVQYRECPPAEKLGLNIRYGWNARWSCPEDKDARTTWEYTLCAIEELVDANEEFERRKRVSDGYRAQGLDAPPATRRPFRISPLTMAALRCGFRLDEKLRWASVTYPDHRPAIAAHVDWEASRANPPRRAIEPVWDFDHKTDLDRFFTDRLNRAALAEAARAILGQ